MTYQVLLHVGADICGILGDINGDSGTIRTDLSEATLVTSKSLFPTLINYLILIQISISPPSNDTTMTVATPNAQESTEENQTTPSDTPMTVANSTENVPNSSLVPVTTPSNEEASNDRLKESSNN